MGPNFLGLIPRPLLARISILHQELHEAPGRKHLGEDELAVLRDQPPQDSSHGRMPCFPWEGSSDQWAREGAAPPTGVPRHTADPWDPIAARSRRVPSFGRRDGGQGQNRTGDAGTSGGNEAFRGRGRLRRSRHDLNPDATTCIRRGVGGLAATPCRWIPRAGQRYGYLGPTR